MKKESIFLPQFPSLCVFSFLLFRFRRATHVTPKSYLNFIAGYKNIYQQKQKELGDGVEKMDTGLEKLAEASASVEILKQDLALMEKDLAEASQKVNQQQQWHTKSGGH